MFPVMMLGGIQQRLHPRLRKAPRSRVQRLLLRPHNRLGVLVHVEVFLELRPWEGVELLDARDGDLVFLVGGAVFVEGGVGLARAQDDALDFFGGGDGVVGVRGIGDDPLEAGVFGEFFDVGAGEGVAEEGFGEEEEEGFVGC